jgi:hypothetical protein
MTTMNGGFSSVASGRLLGLVAIIAALGAGPARADLITFSVQMTFDPNSTPQSTLGPNGPGTVTGTFTIDTSIPINNLNAPTQPPGAQVTNLVSADLLEASNNGTILSAPSGSTTQTFTDVTPYQIMFIGQPTTIYPNTAVFHDVGGMLYEEVTFSSPPVVDSIQEGPWIQFDFPFPVGGSIIPGNFDSIASTGFNSYLFGTVTPLATVPEPSSLALGASALAIGLCIARARRKRA